LQSISRHFVFAIFHFGRFLCILFFQFYSGNHHYSKQLLCQIAYEELSYTAILCSLLFCSLFLILNLIIVFQININSDLSIWFSVAQLQQRNDFDVARVDIMNVKIAFPRLPELIVRFRGMPKLIHFVTIVYSFHLDSMMCFRYSITSLQVSSFISAFLFKHSFA